MGLDAHYAGISCCEVIPEVIYDLPNGILKKH